MLRRFFTCLAVLCLVAAPVPVRAAEPKTAEPDVVVRVQSIDGLLTHVKYIASLVGEEEKAKQLEGMLKAKAGPKGLDGVDTRRPFGLYATIAPNPAESTGVVLVPVSDEQALLGLLKNLNFPAEKGKDDIYSIKTDQSPFPVFLRFANKYAYVTVLTPDTLAKDKLLDPAQVLAMKPTAVASAALRIDKIPDNLKQMAIQQLELQIAEATKKGLKGTEAEKKFQTAVSSSVSDCLVSVIRDGGQVAVELSIDAKTNMMTAEVSLTGKPNSKLAIDITKLGQGSSVVSGMVGKDSAMSILARASMPENVRQAFGQLWDAEMPKALEKEKIPAKRELATKAFKALEQSIKAGELDMVVDLRGPSENKLYAMVMGVQVKNGTDLDKVLREAVKNLPAAEQAKIKLDADQAGPFKIHSIEGPKDDKEYQKNFGNNPVYMSLRPDALVIGLGDKGLKALKEALLAPAKPGVPFRLEASVARLAPLGKDFTGVPKAAEQVLAKEKDGDKVRITLEGGKSLKLRLDAKLTLVKFFSEIQKAQGKSE